MNREQELFRDTSVDQDQSSAGATLIEYVLLILLVGLACVAAVTFLGTQASGTFNEAGAGFQIHDS